VPKRIAESASVIIAPAPAVAEEPVVSPADPAPPAGPPVPAAPAPALRGTTGAPLASVFAAVRFVSFSYADSRSIGWS